MIHEDLPVVPVGLYLGPVRDDDGTVLHRVRLGDVSEPLESDVEAALWLTAHSLPDLAEPTTVWNRSQLLALQPDPGAAESAFTSLLADGLLAAVGADFADRYRLMPLTFGRGWQDNGDGTDTFAIGAAERAVEVDETVLRVWECGADFPTLRAACAAAAPDRDDAALSAVVADLHRLLAVNAAYVEPAGAVTSR